MNARSTITTVAPPPPLLLTADDLAAMLHHAARAWFGALALSADVLVQSVADSTPTKFGEAERRAAVAGAVADAAIGVGWRVAHLSADVGVRLVRLTSPAVAVVLDPPLVATRFTPREVLSRMTATWLAERPGTIRSFTSLSETITPSAAGVIEDVVDVEAILVGALQQVDLERLLNDLLAQVDLTGLVLTHVDVVALADAVIQGVDLPRIIRESSGSVATETADTMRLQAMQADRAVSGLVDRLMRRRGMTT